jgi:hypothetical protein
VDRDLSKPETYVEYVKQASVIVDNVFDASETERGHSNKKLLDLVVEVGPIPTSARTRTRTRTHTRTRTPSCTRTRSRTHP